MDKLVVFWLCLLSANFHLRNCDTSTSDTEQFLVNQTSVSAKEIQPIKDEYDQCYVNVAVYNSMSYQHGVSNVTVTVLSREKKSGSYNYTGFSRGQTDALGRICLLVNCRHEGLIFAEQNSLKLFAAPTPDQMNHLPPYFKVDVLDLGKVIHFHSFVWGLMAGATGPVYNNDEKQMCESATSKDHRFVFSYISIPDKLFSTLSPPDNSNPFKTDAWRYSVNGVGHTCYMKVMFETKLNTYKLEVSSYLNYQSGKLLGVFRTGVTADITSNKTTSKYACAQFRCPVRDVYKMEMNTSVIGVISDVNGVITNQCCPIANPKEPVHYMNQTTFSAKFVVDKAYGPDYGVYKADTQQKALDRCLTEKNYVSGSVVVDKGFALKYICQGPCEHPIIG